MPKKPTGGSVSKKQANPRPGLRAKEKVTGSRPKPKGLPVPVMRKVSAGSSRTKKVAASPRVKKARSYLVKSSGTTKGEVRGVMQAIRSGKMSKGGAIKALKGGPTAGVAAGNKKKVAKAIRTVKSRKYRAL